MEWFQIIRDPHHDVCDAWEGQTCTMIPYTVPVTTMRIRKRDKLAAALKKILQCFAPPGILLCTLAGLWSPASAKSAPPPTSLVGLSKGDSSRTSEFWAGCPCQSSSSIFFASVLLATFLSKPNEEDGHVGDSFIMSIMFKEALLERVTSMFERHADTFRNHLKLNFFL